MNFNAKNANGFPEWLPSAKIIENQFIQTISSVYESFGFAPIETAAVEKTQDLTTSGDVSKEIYGIHRLAGEESKTKYGLHFDLTLPLARYTAANYADLIFPFKRYQIQKVWRGERPQKGRYREFYQADIDIIGDEKLPSHYEAETLEVIYTLFTKLNIGEFTLKVNNRKLLEGYYKFHGITDIAKTLIAIDKIDKIGEKEVQKLLITNGLNQNQAEICTDLASQKFSISESFAFLESLPNESEELNQAKEELKTLFTNLKHLPDNAIVFDLSVARGLDYYTGSVFECTLEGLESYGSVCSGGRYDNLAEKFSKKKLPGVGVSIGLSRLLTILFNEGKISLGKSSPLHAVIILFNESQRPNCNKIATDLREKGLNVEVSPDAKKFGKQIKYAEKKGAGFIIIPEEDGSVSMKNLTSGKQEKLEIQSLLKYIKESHY